MDNKYAEKARIAFQKEAARVIGRMSDEMSPWTVPSGMRDFAKTIVAAITLGGLDIEAVTPFTDEEAGELGKKAEMFRRLNMNDETRELLLNALKDRGIVLENSPKANS